MIFKNNYFTQIQKAIQECPIIFLQSESTPIAFQTTVLEVNEDLLLLKNTVSFEYIRSFVDSKLFNLQLGSIRLSSSSIKSSGKNIIFPLENIYFLENSRKNSRFMFATNEDVVCNIINPFDKTTILHKRILDMSSSGLSFIGFKHSKLFYKDLKLDIEVIVDGKIYSKKHAQVIYSRTICDIKGKIKKHIGLMFIN